MIAPEHRTGVRAPVGVDFTRASISRVYDYGLGGKDNYSVDRMAFDRIREVAPRQGDVFRMNRRWLHRVVRYLTGPARVRQILDLGAGLPTFANTHEVAQQENKAVEVVYVDNDPVCAAHGRVLLERNDRTHYVEADILEARTALENAQVTQHFDMTNPIGVLIGGLLHHLDDDLEPAKVVREYVNRLPGGSYVAISAYWDPAEENSDLHELARSAEKAHVEMGLGSGWYRTREQLHVYFDGLELLLLPGLVELEAWWPAGPAWSVPRPEARLMLGGVGYKRPPLRQLPSPTEDDE